jgi:hypothetical protein
MELLSQLGVVIVALSSLLSLVVIPVFTAWRDRRRALLVSYQAGLTDAIHRELGRAGRDRSTRPRRRPACPGPDARSLCGGADPSGNAVGWPIFATWRPADAGWPPAQPPDFGG